MSKILSEQQQKEINKLDWYLIAVSREIDKVSAMFERIKSLGGKYKKITSKYEKLISFKLKQAQQISMSIEEDIFNSSFDLYKQHYGLFKNKNALLEEREIKLSYEFESFLTQLKTILDLVFKYLGELELNKKIGRIDSFEKITREFEKMKISNKGNHDYRKAEAEINKMKKEPILKEIFRNLQTLYEIKNYRDYIIHHGNIVQDKYISPKERYLEYNYGLPKLTRSKSGYRINDKSTRRLDYFCRLKLLEEIYLIWITLSKIIDKSKIEEIQKKFSEYSSSDVKTVLKFVGRKLLFNDRSMIEENELKKILNKKNFNFNELIVEQSRTERMSEGSKSVDGKDMSHLIKRTLFKPIGYLQVNKIEYIYDRDWIPPEQIGIRYGIVDWSFDLKNLTKKQKEIINLFIQLGLVIYLKEEDRYTLIDKDLEKFIASLISLSQLKWVAISHPKISYFREFKEREKEVMKNIFGIEYKIQIKRVNDERGKVDKTSKIYKMYESLLKDSTKKYAEMVRNEKKNYLKAIKQFKYLKPALKLINEDMFLKKPKLD